MARVDGPAVRGPLPMRSRPGILSLRADWVRDGAPVTYTTAKPCRSVGQMHETTPDIATTAWADAEFTHALLFGVVLHAVHTDRRCGRRLLSGSGGLDGADAAGGC